MVKMGETQKSRYIEPSTFGHKTSNEKGSLIHRQRRFQAKMAACMLGAISMVYHYFCQISISTSPSCSLATSRLSINNCVRPMAKLSKRSFILANNYADLLKYRAVIDVITQVHQQWETSDRRLSLSIRENIFTACIWLFPVEQKVDWKDCSQIFY